jgi:hypothetical protein
VEQRGWNYWKGQPLFFADRIRTLQVQFIGGN